jgi:hypothetical protein
VPFTKANRKYERLSGGAHLQRLVNDGCIYSSKVLRARGELKVKRDYKLEHDFAVINESGKASRVCAL